MRRLWPSASILVVMVVAVPGCGIFHDYRHATVLIRDAETKQPIAGAEVRLSYVSLLDPFAPWPSSGKTGQDGTTRLWAVAYEGAGAVMSVSADGYHYEVIHVSAEAVRSIGDGKSQLRAVAGSNGLTSLMPATPAVHVHEQKQATGNGKAQPSIVVDLYSKPEPSVELIVPTGYRGMVVAEVKLAAEEDVSGKRAYCFKVPASGVVEIKGSEILRRGHTEYKACYADGTRLDRYADKETVGFRWITCDWAREFFAIGTQKDYDDCFRLINKRVDRWSWAHDPEAVEAWVKARRSNRGASSSEGTASAFPAVLP
jgi:hypothetical protein